MDTIDITKEQKAKYLQDNILSGDFKTSFEARKRQNPYRMPERTYVVYKDIVNMKVYCNNTSVLQDEHTAYIYEYCHNVTHKFKNYRYVIYIRKYK